ncbi:MAG: hypothetical protein NTV06_06025 [candidate division Zixibacteria bacterium]|nr:hypothetical protein [candidate division Zixibacteria bacterium]
MRCLLLLISLVFLLFGGSAVGNDILSDTERVTPTYVLNVCGDSVWYRFGDYTGSFPIDSSFFNRIDTINATFDHDLILYSRIDSVTIKRSLDPVRLLAICSPDTGVKMVIFYENEEKRSEAGLQRKLKVLRDYPHFGHMAVDKYGPFTYSGSDDSNLVRLRETYNLDSVAGSGNEIQRIINLMRWAHNIVKHDGSSTNPTPTPTNALNLISICQKENRGVNCRMIATILNETYLSVGFKSRHITCMPADTTDPDCHVINIVYSDGLKKWLYMDPTFEAYYMDRDSNLLSIAEVRATMIRGDSPILSNGINWNGSPTSVVSYNGYMAKNLFRFSCPLRSEFGYESKEGEMVWVHLNPVGYNSERKGASTVNETGKRKLIKYYTDNDEYFWAEP